MTARAMRISAHVFIERDGLVLVLQQADGFRWWELPGGELEEGETPDGAAVREVFEETGLVVESPALLRTWSYANRDEELTLSHEFATTSAAGDVVLSDEHSDYAWLSCADYAERYCGDPPAGAPSWIRSFLAEMRANCDLFARWQQERKAGHA